MLRCSRIDNPRILRDKLRGEPYSGHTHTRSKLIFTACPLCSALTFHITFFWLIFAHICSTIFGDVPSQTTLVTLHTVTKSCNVQGAVTVVTASTATLIRVALLGCCASWAWTCRFRLACVPLLNLVSATGAVLSTLFWLRLRR